VPLLAWRRLNGRFAAAGLVTLLLGLGAGFAAAGCGEDRGSVQVEDSGTTGGSTVGTTDTTGTTTTP